MESKGEEWKKQAMKEGKLSNLQFQTVSIMKNIWGKVEKCVLYSLAEDKNDRIA